MATILIVDDLSANRAFLVTLLGAQGHRMLQAADGSEALAVVRAEHPDLMITDVLMPVMDGYELVRQLRLDPATSSVRVVFSTAHYGEREARALALSGGVSDVLTKPISVAAVLTIVGRVLAGKPKTLPEPSSFNTQFDREHLRLLTDKLSGTTGDLTTADALLQHARTDNARLRALINIGLEIASERDSGRLLQRVCVAARDLFGATYVTLGILDRTHRTVQRFIACGFDDGGEAPAADWFKAGEAVPGILGTVVAERRTLRGHNPDGDPGRLELPPSHPDVHAYLAAPLVSPTHVYGWICLVGNEGRTFTEEDEHMVLALAGQVGRIYELEHELQEREQAEWVARDERARAQRYLDVAEVVLLALDSRGRITLVNRYACSLLGRTADQLLGRDFIGTCVPPRLQAETRAKLGNLLAGPDSSIADNAILTGSGEERLIEWRNTLVRDDDGRVVSTLSSGTDLTERNQATEALRAAEERMRFALESANVGIWDIDYATGVIQWSGLLERQYGLLPGTFGGCFDEFMARVHPDDRQALGETLASAIKTGADFSVLHRVVRPDGTVRWLSGAGRILLGANGEAVRGVGISQDVTDRRVLEEQYHQAQKMEAVGRLAGGVAHDFNNLLTAILGYSELLLVAIDPSDPRRADVVEIQNAGTHAARLTQQLLAFSRKEIVRPTLLDVNVIVEETRAILARVIGEDVKVVVALEPALAPIKADRGQVEQIIMNLAVNARDAMPGGGILTIRTGTVELDKYYEKTHFAVKPGVYVVLTVTDTGTGMSSDVQARAFEPFFTTKAVGKGTGLGLATVHGIVTAVGGLINVYSEVGIGTSFKVYFPRASAAATATAAAPAPAPRLKGRGETVLVVEDADGVRELTRRMLLRDGYTVLIAANAEEAVGTFERHPSVDVVLTDVVMPGSSGPELTARLLKQQPALKVIYMSGYTEDAIAHHGVLNPGITFLHKPFNAETLGRIIREVLDRPALVTDGP